MTAKKAKETNLPYIITYQPKEPLHFKRWFILYYFLIKFNHFL